MTTYLSYGAGQDSWTILALLTRIPELRLRFAPGPLEAIMSDTGDEHDATYEHVAYTKLYCEQHVIPFHFVTSSLGFHSPSWPSLRHYYRTKNAIGSKSYPKSCTDQLKIRPIYNFLEDRLAAQLGIESQKKKAFHEHVKKTGQKIRMLIGIAAGEETRLSDGSRDPVWMRACIEKVYPLVELKMNRQACQDYLKAARLPIPQPSNCKLCPYMSEQELVWLYRFDRPSYDDWVVLEQAKIEANRDHCEGMNKPNFGVWGDKLLPQVLVRALSKYGHWTDEQLQEYKMSHGHCVQSKY